MPLNNINRPKQLAILGGEPSFTHPLHVGAPNIGNRQAFFEYTNQMFDRKWLTNRGVLVREFEKQVSAYLGVNHFIAVCNATVGLEAVLRGMGLQGEIILPSFTFIATAHAAQWVGLKPVFCDIDPITHNIDPDKVEELITPNTSAILGVHLWGRACADERLTKIAKKFGLRLIYDGAHAFGCSLGSQMIGNLGDAEVFSFHATKFFNTFEGGGIATNDDHLAEKFRATINFGFTNYDEVSSLGTNGKMTEPAAAMGLTNLRSLDHFVSTNKQNFQAYETGLQGIDGISLVKYQDSDLNNHQYIVLEIDEAKSQISRNLVYETLQSENILARRYFWPGCHRMEPYRTLYPSAGLLLPQTEWLSERTLLLPTGTAVGPTEITEICQIIRTAVDQSAMIKKEVHNNG